MLPKLEGGVNVEWILGNNDSSTGLLELEDGTLIAKETMIGDQGSVIIQSLKLLLSGRDRMK